MIARFFGRLRRRDGQSLILFAIGLPVMLLFLAFVVDAAHAFVDYRHLQNSADASALAAAQQINSGTVGCGTVKGCATQYVSYNNGPTLPNTGLPACADSSGSPISTHISSDPSATPNCYQWPYYDSSGSPQSQQVVVWLYQCTSTFFGSIIGVNQICGSVHSVARASFATQTTVYPGTTVNGTVVYATITNSTTINGTTIYTPTTIPQTIVGTTSPATTIFNTNTSSSTSAINTTQNDNAMFASDTTCSSGDGITFDMNNATVNGFVHSNGLITLKKNGNTIDGASYGQSSCPPTGSTFDSETVDTSYNSPPLPSVPWPVNWSSTPTSTICSGGNYKGVPPSDTLTGSYAGGIWCDLTPGATITVVNPPASGLLTVVASSIVVPHTSNGVTWPDGQYSNGTNGLLFYATGATTTAIDIGSNNDTFPSNGFLFAPNGTILLEFNNGSNGFWEAKDIEIEKNNFTMTGNGPGGTPTVVYSTTYATTTVPASTQYTTRAGTTIYGTGTNATTIVGTTNQSASTSSATLPGTTQTGTAQTATTATNIGLGG